MQLTRRGFILATASIVPLSPLWAFSCPMEDAISALIKIGEDVDVIRCIDASFGFESAINNLLYENTKPKAVVKCYSSSAISKVLEICKQYQIEFAIKGGGHNYAGFSTSNGIVISTTGMKTITYDDCTKQVTVEAGAANGAVYSELKKAGRTITHGRCPTVGVAGFILGGGIGFDMRKHGLAIDGLISTEMVLADGTVVTASASNVGNQSYEDLFWALRGGAGGNFGVSTSFTIQTAELPTSTTVFDLTWKIPDADHIVMFMKALQESPNELGSRISIQYDHQNAYHTLNLVGQWTGRHSDFHSYLPHPFSVDESLSNHTTLFRELTDYWHAQALLAENDVEGFTYRETSTFVSDVPSVAMFKAVLDALSKAPRCHGPVDLRFFQTGGKINTVTSDDTAFVHRDNNWLMLVGVYCRDEIDNKGEKEICYVKQDISQLIAWQDDIFAKIKSVNLTKGSYQNFPFRGLENWQQEYYGENYARLQQIKGKYDPENIFNFEQSIEGVKS